MPVTIDRQVYLCYVYASFIFNKGRSKVPDGQDWRLANDK